MDAFLLIMFVILILVLPGALTGVLFEERWG